MKKIYDKEIETRIDLYMMDILNISRSKVQKMLDDNLIKVNNKKVKNSYNLRTNDLIEYEEYKEKSLDVISEKMDLEIVYEDEDVLVVNKANGVVVHPGNGNYSHTLVNGLKFYSNLSDINGEFRPGVVHRIDAYTTGLIMIAKNNKAHLFLANQLEKKTVYRKYVALVWGVISEDSGTIDAPIGRDKKDRKKMAVTLDGKNAVTHFTVLKRLKNATLVELKLETGRTHQIRVHMDYINHPVVNDPVYGRRKLIDSTGQALHAKELGFIHPTTLKYMEFNSELPTCFLNILSYFEDDLEK